MQQSIHTSQVDEGAKIGDVFDDSFAHLSLFQLLDDPLAQSLAFLLEHCSARNHNVAPCLVQLDDLELEGLAEELVEVLDLANVDLRTGKESLDTQQVDDDTALDAASEAAINGRAAVVGLLDAVPHTHEVGFLLGEDDPTFEVLHVFQKNFDFGAYFDRFGGVAEFLERDGSFRLEADINEDFSWRGADDAALDDFALLDAGEAVIVHGHQIIELLLGVLGSVEILYADIPIHRLLVHECRGRGVSGRFRLQGSQLRVIALSFDCPCGFG